MATAPQDRVASAILLRELLLISHGGFYLTSPFTTTVVNSWVTVLGPTAVDLPTSKALHKSTLAMHLTHTVGSAKAACSIAISQDAAGLVNPRTAGLADRFTLPANPGDAAFLALEGLGYYDYAGFLPPTVYISVAVWNYTPGTLTAFFAPAYDSLDWQSYGRVGVVTSTA